MCKCEVCVCVWESHFSSIPIKSNWILFLLRHKKFLLAGPASTDLSQMHGRRRTREDTAWEVLHSKQCDPPKSVVYCRFFIVILLWLFYKFLLHFLVPTFAAVLPLQPLLQSFLNVSCCNGVIRVFVVAYSLQWIDVVYYTYCA